jgi:hypothetical protein
MNKVIHRDGFSARIVPDVPRLSDPRPSILYANGTTSWRRHGKFHRRAAAASLSARGEAGWYEDGMQLRSFKCSACGHAVLVSVETMAKAEITTCSGCQRTLKDRHARTEARMVPARDTLPPGGR